MNPRQQGKVTYPLDEILLLRLLAVLAGIETFVDIALFSCKKLGLTAPGRTCDPGLATSAFPRPPWNP